MTYDPIPPVDKVKSKWIKLAEPWLNGHTGVTFPKGTEFQPQPFHLSGLQFGWPKWIYCLPDGTVGETTVPSFKFSKHEEWVIDHTSPESLPDWYVHGW